MTAPDAAQVLELLAEWLEAEAACDGTQEASALAVLARSRLLALTPAAVRAQAQAQAAATREEALRAALARIRADQAAEAEQISRAALKVVREGGP